MGNQCYAADRNIPPTVETLEQTKTFFQPLPSSLIIEQKTILPSIDTTVSPTDITVTVPVESIKITRKGTWLKGIPQIEQSIKQTWTSIQTFIPSYYTHQQYQDPFVFEETGQIYYGQWRDGVPEGKGFLYTPHTELFEGSFRHGLKDGRARVIFKGRHIFQGQYTDGRIQGNFKYLTDSFRFEGNIDGKRINGFGEEKTDEYTYKGSYLNGRWLQGQLTWKDNIYVGKFNQLGKPHGKGQLKNRKGLYTGQFRNGIKDGKGQFVSAIGWRYDGSYQGGKKHGFGTLFLKNGQISYEGDWHDDLPHGSGFTVKNGNKQPICQWIHGVSSDEIRYWKSTK